MLEKRNDKVSKSFQDLIFSLSHVSNSMYYPEAHREVWCPGRWKTLRFNIHLS